MAITKLGKRKWKIESRRKNEDVRAREKRIRRSNRKGEGTVSKIS